MLIVISPAKTLNFEQPAPVARATQPDFLEQAKEINTVLKHYSPTKLQTLQKISPKLAQLNAQRNQAWALPFSLSNAKQALFAFQGDVYEGLGAQNWLAKDIAFAQQHLRILSGLYGLLRPLDLIQPYRLEMGTKLANPRGKDLYSFWGTTITETLKKQLRGQPLVNLASQEYFSAIDPTALGSDVIEPVFKEGYAGNYKIISFHAKKARGKMSAWIIRNRPEKPADLRDFAGDGYQFSASDSKGKQMVFLRSLK
jgi:cytoplasmic iron level regulating protein YaaA (DUF328/UPF0246 family)